MIAPMGLGWHSGSEGVHSAVCQLLVVILILTLMGQSKSDHNNSISSGAGKDHETNSNETEKGNGRIIFSGNIYFLDAKGCS